MYFTYVESTKSFAFEIKSVIMSVHYFFIPFLWQYNNLKQHLNIRHNLSKNWLNAQEQLEIYKLLKDTRTI